MTEARQCDSRAATPELAIPKTCDGLEVHAILASGVTAIPPAPAGIDLHLRLRCTRFGCHVLKSSAPDGVNTAHDLDPSSPRSEELECQWQFVSTHPNVAELDF